MRRICSRPFLLLALMTVMLLVLTGCGGGGGSGNSPNTYTHQKAYHSPTGLNALVYLPEGYNDDASTLWPVIIYLHGMNQRGNSLNILIPGSGPPSRIESGFTPPFIVVSPQCPMSTVWSNPTMVENLYRFINELTGVYRIDPKRINLTGFSMGGDGTWALAVAHHEIFAAVAPVGASSYYQNVTLLKDKPVWVFHGQNDTTCPINNDRAMVQALQNAGSTSVRFTVFPNADHGGSCTLTYLDDPDDDIYKWFAQQTLP